MGGAASLSPDPKGSYNRQNNLKDENIESEETEANDVRTDETGVYIKNMDEAIELMGGFGFHQVKALLLYLNMMTLGNYVLYPMGFYEL